MTDETRKQVALKIKPSLHKLAKTVASKENRAFNNYVECLIIDDIQKKGYWLGNAGEQPNPKATP